MTEAQIVKLSPYHFTFECWKAGSLTELNIDTRTVSIQANKHIIRDHAIGYLKGSSLWVRPKLDAVAVMFYANGIHFWTHLRKKEFNICFPEVKI